MNEYFAFLIPFALLTAIMIAVGRILARTIGSDSKSRRAHGVFVLRWSIGGFILGGVLAPFISAADTQQGFAGMAGFGLLIGWIIGMVHGYVVLVIRPVDHLSQNPRKR